jgi:hypothetical protein
VVKESWGIGMLATGRRTPLKGKTVIGKYESTSNFLCYRTYTGPDKERKGLTNVVVKQSRAGSDEEPTMGLEGEAMALESFKTSRSPHIIKMYRRLYREQGHGSMQLDMGIVHRIFMEYCPGGDLQRWASTKFVW